MELLREIINNLIILEPRDDMVLLRKSQEMDVLILQSIKRSNFVTILGKNHIKRWKVAAEE